ncbi:MAG: winged helix-turn-helix domain-containing protein [Pirellulales bacterium]
MDVPAFHELMNSLFRALRELGGSGSIAEIEDKVSELLELPEEVLELPHNAEKSNQSEFQYRLAWARTYLKQYGLIDNSQRGIWVIASDKREVKDFDPQAVVREVRENHRKNREEKEGAETGSDEEIAVPEEAEAWRESLHRVLTEVVSPEAFERLVQRLLRESGFVHVEVTGRSGEI